MQRSGFTQPLSGAVLVLSLGALGAHSAVGQDPGALSATPPQQSAAAPPDAAQQRDAEQRQLEREWAEQAWREHDPNEGGAALLSLAGDVAILDPSAASSGQRLAGLGFAFAFVARGKYWPVLVGAGAGVTYFGDSTTNGPRFLGTEPNGRFYVGPTRRERTIELRHLELLARVQPWWGRVRPYLEGEFGFMAFSTTSTLRDRDAYVLSARDRQQSISYLTGGTLGVDLKLVSLDLDPVYNVELVLSVGLKRLYTGRMLSPDDSTIDSGGVQTNTVRSHLHIWQPFVSLGLSSDVKKGPPP